MAVPIRCRSWDCTSCAKKNKRHLLRRLRKSQPNLFVTLTTSTRTAPTPEEAFHVASQGVTKLLQRWRRFKPADPLEYFLVWERTKAGWPHIHLLLKAPLVSKHWLSQTWRELTGSYIVDLQKVSSLIHAARYLAKYLAKDPAVPQGFRRWRRSAHFFVRDDNPRKRLLPAGTTWHREPHDLATLKYLWLRRGLQPFTEANGLLKGIRDPLAAELLRQSSYFSRLEQHVRIVAPGLLA